MFCPINRFHSLLNLVEDRIRCRRSQGGAGFGSVAISEVPELRVEGPAVSNIPDPVPDRD